MHRVIYVHSYSEDERNDQYQTCKHHIEDHGHTPDGSIVDDDDTYPQALIETLENTTPIRIYVARPKVLADNWRDVSDIARRLTERGHELYIVRDDVYIEDKSDARALTYAAKAERDKLKERQIGPAAIQGEKHFGRPPLGYTTGGEGRLRPVVEDDDRAGTYDTVVQTLLEVTEGTTSIKAAANRLNSSRTTIRNAIRDRPEMYELPNDATIPRNPRRGPNR